MLPPNKAPIGSLERLNELGLDPKLYGSCSQKRIVEIEGKGRVVMNQGCYWHPDCEWANQPMPDPKPDVMRPRPRMLKTRLIKPSGSGRGDIMRENYCSCCQWHSDLKNRDGKNDEMAEVVGGEGDTYVFRGTGKAVPNGDGTFSFPPLVDPAALIPSFPDPLEAAALNQDVATAAIKKSARESRRQKRRDARLGLSEAEPNEPVNVDIDLADVQRAIASGNQ